MDSRFRNSGMTEKYAIVLIMSFKKLQPLKVLIYCNAVTKKCISKASLIEKSPPSPLCQRGAHFLPLAKGGEEGFYNQCLHTYDRISNSIIINGLKIEFILFGKSPLSPLYLRLGESA